MKGFDSQYGDVFNRIKGFAPSVRILRTDDGKYHHVDSIIRSVVSGNRKRF